MVEKIVNRRGMTLTELVIAIALMAILISFAAPPFLTMLRRSTAEESAQRLHEAIKSAQTEAQKRGFTNFSSSTGFTFAKQVIYVALFPDLMRIRIISWQDRNQNLLKTNDEFTLIQELYLGKGTTFSLPATINKKACNNTSGAPSSSIVNFSNGSDSPIGLTLFPPGTQYIKFNTSGFSDSMRWNAVYISDSSGNTYAITINPLGLTDLCRWEGKQWLKLR
jgi:prepilin-type N-terminal cleavage/methylation domain-containing protein